MEYEVVGVWAERVGGGGVRPPGPPWICPRNGWDLIDPARYMGTFVVQIWAENIVHGTVASLVDGIAFWMEQGGEYPLDS